MSRLNIHPFILFYNDSFLCLIFQDFLQFYSRAIIYVVGTAILLRINVDYVFFPSITIHITTFTTTESGWNSLKVIFIKKFFTESSHFLVFWCIPCTATPVSISSEMSTIWPVFPDCLSVSYDYDSTYHVWCKYFNVTPVENFRLNHDHLLNLSKLFTGQNLSNSRLQNVRFYVIYNIE